MATMLQPIETFVEPHLQQRTKLSLRGVSRDFVLSKGNMVALDDIDLEVGEGEFVCIVGPSGCGKSTLLNLIAGLDHPTRGEIVLVNARVHGPGPDRILLFQEHGLFPWLNVTENVEFGLRMTGVPAKARRERAREYLRLVHLGRFENSYIHQLSGGMKQRVALARSLAMEPSLLLMDEPFAALDAQTRDMLHDELERIWTETRKTIVFITHNVREAVRLGDRVVLLTYRPGRIKQEFVITLPRPRHVEEPDVAHVASEVLACLREETQRAALEEFNREEVY
jgi:NitT/TauT family transport system ATP-binding protein